MDNKSYHPKILQILIQTMATVNVEHKKETKKAPKLRFPEFEGEWFEKKIGEIFTVKAGGDIDSEYASEKKTEKFKYPIYANAKKNKGLYGYSDKFKISKPSVTIAGRGVYIGIAHARDYKFYPIVRLLVLTPKREQSVFFYEHAINQLKIFIESTGVPQLTGPQISSYKINFPTLPEQQKIASFLSAVDQKIQQLTRKKELLEQYKKGVMQKIFSQEIRFKDENGNDYPDWEEKRLGEIIYKMQSGISRKLSDTDIGIPILRSNNLINGKLDVSDIKFWYLKDNQGTNLENYYLREGDLLVNFINSIAQIGKVALYENLLQRDTIFTTNLMRLSFKENVNHYFVFYYFHLKIYTDYIQSITKPAVNQASFTTKDFQNFELFFPSLSEQQKISTFLSKIDKKIESLNNQLTQTQQFKKGLLQQMFV